MCAALVLAARPAGEPERTTLEGRTSRGLRVEMNLVDGKVRHFDTTASVHCPDGMTRVVRWNTSWSARERLRHDGSRFQVRERFERPAIPEVIALGMRGQLSDDGESARGTLYGRWDWRGFVCEGRVRFSAG